MVGESDGRTGTGVQGPLPVPVNCAAVLRLQHSELWIWTWAVLAAVLPKLAANSKESRLLRSYLK